MHLHCVRCNHTRTIKLCPYLHHVACLPCVQVTFNGNGPLGSVQVIAESNGLVKGKVGHPDADPPLRLDGKLNVGAAVGRGEWLQGREWWAGVSGHLIEQAGLQARRACHVWQSGWVAAICPKCICCLSAIVGTGV